MVLACVHALNRPQSVTKSQPALKSTPAQSKPVDHNAHLIGHASGFVLNILF